MSMTTVKWRINKSENFVALSDEPRQMIATRFSLSTEEMSRLSDDLSRALDVKLRRKTILLEEVAKEGEAAFHSSMYDIDKAMKYLKSARSKLRLLDISTPIGPDTYVSPVDRLFNLLIAAGALAGEARAGFGDAVAAGMPLNVRETANARRRGDTRRSTVCGCIIWFWDDLGRPVTYTTDPLTNERKGTLVEFITAIVSYVTEPSAKLSGETIKREITKAKKNIERDRALLEGASVTTRQNDDS